MLLRLFFGISILFIFISCSKDEPVYKINQKSNPYTLYKEAYDDFKVNDYFSASKKFSEAEINFKNINFAAKSAIMVCFSLYGINFYDESLENIDRFIKLYPSDKNLIYAEYLKAIIYFEMMSDEKKDIEPVLKANEQIDIFIKKYPDSDYSKDLRFKKDLVQNQLAAKELYISRYYISVQKWIPAINRLKVIVEKYDETIFIEEALHRLVEIHYYLGLSEEAQKYATLLGYNYNSSKWFKQSYKLLNKNYEIKKILDKKNNDNFLKKIIKMIK